MKTPLCPSRSWPECWPARTASAASVELLNVSYDPTRAVATSTRAAAQYQKTRASPSPSSSPRRLELEARAVITGWKPTS